jgi:hypothetical protein
MMSFDQIGVAAIGGLLALLAKYVVDQFTESRKVAMNLVARGREKYFEKQATAITGLYELQVKVIAATIALSVHDLDNTPEAKAKKTKEAQAHRPLQTQASKELQEYVTTHSLFFPDKLLEFLDTIFMMVIKHKNKYDIFYIDDFEQVTQDYLDESKKSREKLREVQDELRVYLRELMRGRDEHLEPPLKGGLKGVNSRLAAARRAFMQDPNPPQPRHPQ